MSSRYKVNDLRAAFEDVEQECPGVCDFLVKEIVSKLVHDQIKYQQFVERMANPVDKKT